MLNFLYSLSDIYVFLILVAFTIAVSICFILINKLFIYRKLHYRDNTTISSISALIGIIYGVLVGFLCLYLINNQDHATQAVLNEANALGAIYRQSTLLKQPTQENLQKNIRTYINEVINDEWPAMSNFQKN